jgi:hypothetical protein
MGLLSNVLERAALVFLVYGRVGLMIGKTLLRKVKSR